MARNSATLSERAEHGLQIDHWLKSLGLHGRPGRGGDPSLTLRMTPRSKGNDKGKGDDRSLDADVIANAGRSPPHSDPFSLSHHRFHNVRSSDTIDVQFV